MYKHIIILALFTLFCHADAAAQWTKVMGKNSFLEYPESITKYHNTLIMNKVDGFYYSKDNGAVWRNLKPTIFKSTDTLHTLSSLINEQGIFLLMAKIIPIIRPTTAIYTDSTFILFTPNLGLTWEKTALPIYRLNRSSIVDNYIFVQTKDYIFLYADGYDSPDLSTYNRKFIVFRYKKKEKKWEEKTSEYANYPSVYKVTDLAEYYADSDKFSIKNHSTGQIIKKELSPSGGEYSYFVTDSLLYSYSKNSSKITEIYFSNNQASTWYDIGSSFPLPNEDAGPSFYMYRNKLYGISNGRYYASTDKGLTWKLESDILTKYSTGIKPYYMDSVALFKTEVNMHFGYNLITKKVTYYNTEIVYNFGAIYEPTKKIDRLPDGRFLYNTEVPFTQMVSDTKGENWRPTVDYPFYFTRVQVNDSTFYASTAHSDPTEANGYVTTRYVNNKLKDTVSFVPAWGHTIRKGDTIVSVLAKKIYYSTQKPFTKWTLWPNSAFFPTDQVVSFGNKHLITHSDFGAQGRGYITILRAALDGTYQRIEVPFDHSLLNFSQHNDLWFANIGNGRIYHTSDYGKTSTSFRFPAPKFYEVPSTEHEDMLVVAKANNIPKGKVMIVISLIKPYVYITADSGKIWVPFDDGLFGEKPFALLQKDEFLFAFTQDGSLYKRNLSDINLRSVTGIVYLDANGNNIKDANEKPLIAKITSKRTGAFVMSDSTGFYNLLSDIGTTDSIFAEYDNKYAEYFPKFHLVTKSDTSKNFAVRLTPNIQDLSVNLTNIGPARPGFDSRYVLNIKNIGSLPKDATVSVVYNATQSFVSVSTNPLSHANRTLSWRFPGLQPGDNKKIELTLKTNVNAMIGNRIFNIASIDPIQTDAFKADNIDTLHQVIVGSFDPNDKQVGFRNRSTAPSLIKDDTELTYTIRFQNTGNYPADFVRIEDTLSEKLNINSIRVIASSHPYKVSIKKGRVLVFDFNPIFLPDSSSNRVLSQGFIKFSIKPKTTLPQKESIKNTAYIYFDYNPPIKTNVVETKNSIISALISPMELTWLKISPNPAETHIRFGLYSDVLTKKTGRVNIYDISGVLQSTQVIQIDAENQIDVTNLSSGTYILHVYSDEQHFVGKFIVNRQ